MAGKIKGITVVIDGDVTKLNKAIKDARSETKGMQTALRDVNKSLKLDPTNITAISTKQQVLNRYLEGTVAQLQRLRDMESQLSSKSNLTDSEQRELIDLQREIARTEAKYGELRSESIKFGTAASASTLQLKQNLADYGSRLEDIGKKMTLLSAGVAYAGYQSVDAAIQFESSFTGVRKTVNATEEELGRLAEATRRMALEKPIDVNDINYIMELGGQLGIATDALEVFASTVADLDVATDLGLEQGSLQLAQFANVAQMSQKDFDRLGAVITDLGNNSATTESAVMNMAMRIVGSASNIGMTVPQVLALAASLSSVGIQAEMGGNAISTIMNRIDKDVALNTDTLQVWAETAGMSAEDFAGKWRGDVMGALLDVINGMGTFRDEGGNLNTLLKDMDISYMRQVDTMQRLSRTGDLVTGMIDVANNAWDENIALTREANRRYETTESQLQLLKNNLNELGIEFGQIMLPIVRDVVAGAIDLLKAFQNLDDGTKNMIVTVAGITAVAGPATLALGKLLGFASNLIGSYASAKTWLYLFKEGLTASTPEVIKAGDGMDKLSLKTAAAGKAMGIAKGLAAGLALAGLALVVKYMYDAVKRTEDFNKATIGLESATKLSNIALADGTGAFDGFAYAADDAALSVDELVESQAKLKDEIAERYESASSEIGLMEVYKNTIEQLTERYDENGNKIALTAEENAKLQYAVDELNGILGTNYELVDGQVVKYDDAGEQVKVYKDEILKLVEAKKLEIEADALSETYKDMYSKRSEAAKTLAQANSDLASAQEEYNWALEAGVSNLTGHSLNLKIATDNQRKAKESYDALNESMEATDEQITLLTMAMENSDGGYAKIISDNASAMSAIESSGQSLMDFRDHLEEIGVSTEDLADLSEEDLFAMASAYDGNVSSIVGHLDRLGVGYDEAKAASRKAAESMVQDADAVQLDSEGAFADIGTTLDGYMIKLAEAGVSAEALGKLTYDQLKYMVETYGTDTDAIKQYMDEVAQKTSETASAMAQDADALRLDAIDAFTNIGTTLDGYMVKLAEAGVSVEDLNALTYEQLQYVVETYGTDMGAAKAKIDEFVQKNREGGEKAPQEFGSGMSGNAWRAREGASDVVGAADRQFSLADFSSHGYWAAMGFANGMIGRGVLSAVASAGARIVATANEAIRSAQGENSPARVFRPRGASATEGYAYGMTESLRFIDDASDEVVSYASSAMSRYRAMPSYEAQRAIGGASVEPGGATTVNHYSFGDVTFDASDLEDIGTIGDFVDMFERAKYAYPD